MMTDIENGEVGTVIVKDMSRFGRNYIMVGYYTEILFPNAKVRFIAVSDGVDSISDYDNEFTPFRNIINEWYSRLLRLYRVHGKLQNIQAVVQVDNASIS